MASFVFGRMILIALLLLGFAAALAMSPEASGWARLIEGCLARLPDLAQSLVLLGAATAVSVLLGWPIGAAVASRPEHLLSRLMRFKVAMGPVVPSFLLVVALGLVDRSGWLWPVETIARAPELWRFTVAIAALCFGLIPAVIIAVGDWPQGGPSPLETAAFRIGLAIPGLMIVEALLLGAGLGARMVDELLQRDPVGLGTSVLLALAAILLVSAILEGLGRARGEIRP